MINTEIESELLSRVHFYYPIGQPNLYRIYPGFKALQKIIERKRADMDNSASTWKLFINEIKTSFPELIAGILYYPFPNYFLDIQIGTRDAQDVKIASSVRVVVSLLSDYYTVYFHERTASIIIQSYQSVPPIYFPFNLIKRNICITGC